MYSSSSPVCHFFLPFLFHCITFMCLLLFHPSHTTPSTPPPPRPSQKQAEWPLLAVDAPRRAPGFVGLLFVAWDQIPNDTCVTWLRSWFTVAFKGISPENQMRNPISLLSQSQTFFWAPSPRNSPLLPEHSIRLLITHNGRGCLSESICHC